MDSVACVAFPDFENRSPTGHEILIQFGVVAIEGVFKSSARAATQRFTGLLRSPRFEKGPSPQLQVVSHPEPIRFDRCACTTAGAELALTDVLDVENWKSHGLAAFPVPGESGHLSGAIGLVAE